MADEVKITIKLDESDAINSIRKIGKASDSFSKDFTSGIKKSVGALSVFKGAFGALALVEGFRAATRAVSGLFNTIVRDGIRAAQVQEDAINQLNIALKASGRYSEEASKGIQEFASELQQSSKYGDEVVIQTAALIQSLGQLDTQGLKRATKAAVDLSAALGIDLNAAALLVGKAAAGEVGTFSRYGLIIRKAATSTETLNNALTAIENKFGGAAAGQVKTFSGAVAQAGNTWGDLTERIGEAITKNSTVIMLINGLNRAFKSLEIYISNNQEAMQKFINSNLPSVISAIGASIAGTLRVLEFLRQNFVFARGVVELFAVTTIGAMRAIGATINAVFEGARALISSIISFIGDGFTQLTDKVLTPFLALEKAINSVASFVPSIKDAIGGEFTLISDLSEKTSESIKEKFGSAAEFIGGDFSGAVDEIGRSFTELAGVAKDIGKDVAAGLDKSALTSAADAIDKTTDSLVTSLRAQKVEREKLVDDSINREISKEAEKNLKLVELEKQLQEQRAIARQEARELVALEGDEGDMGEGNLERLQEQYGAEIDAYNEKENAKAQIRIDAINKNIQDETKRKEAILKIQQEQDQKGLQMARQYNQKMDALDRQRTDAAVGFARATADAILAVTGDNAVAGLLLSKTFAIAEVFINDARARIAALASTAAIPYPGNLAAYGKMSGIISATTALSLGTIAAQTVAGFARMQEGGIVGRPGASFSQADRIAVLQRPGEMDITTDQQAGLYNFINSLKGFTGTQDIGRGGSPIEVSVQIDGREIARAIKEQTSQGFAIA